MNVVGKKVTKKLGKKIQRLRKEMGYTSQESFAETLGLSRTHVGHIEQGRKNPSMEVLVKIAKKLRVEISDLFGKN
ncbi:MAG: helix-turn-helix transcriptional regulator [Candidatus Shapirobacteria bacterium]|nr:helix-turn-helix transcriptional regulator [Candidatus Shapirobacteria bacterium]